MSTRVAIVTLGCARNEVDSEELAARLSKDGIELVQEPSDADAVLVNTCGFIEAAKKDSIDTLLAANDLKQNSNDITFTPITITDLSIPIAEIKTRVKILISAKLA